MLARKEQTRRGIPLLTNWKESLTGVLNSTYETECLAGSRKFEVYGFTYPNELVVIITLVPTNSQIERPITLFISADVDEKTTSTQLLDDLVDATALFFDSLFASSDSGEFITDWEPAEFKEHKFFTKVSYENIGLTLKADELLGEHSF